MSTATIERIWTSKVDMVAGAIEAMQHQALIPDTGSVRRDCEELVRGAIVMMSSEPIRSVIANLVGEAGRDPELAATLRERLILPRRAAMLQMLAAGVARGELAADADLPVLADLLVAPLYYRLLVSGEPLDPSLAPALVDAVLGNTDAARA